MKTIQEAAASLVRELREAASALTEQTTHRVHVCGELEIFRMPSRIEILKTILDGGAGPTRTGGLIRSGGDEKSKSPLFVQAFDLLVEIRDRSNAEAIELTGIARYCFTESDAVDAWAEAAHLSNDPKTIRRATRRILGWVDRVDSFIEPPILKELAVPCPACGHSEVYGSNADGERTVSKAMSIRIKDRAVVVTCAACTTVWEANQLVGLGSKVTGRTVEDIQRSIREETSQARKKPQGPKTERRRVNFEQVVVDIHEFAQKVGHLPSPRSTDAAERRMGKWMENHRHVIPMDEFQRRRSEAIRSLMDAYPSRRQLRRLHISTTEGMAA